MYKIALIIIIFASSIFAEMDVTVIEDSNSELAEMDETVKNYEKEILQLKKTSAMYLNIFLFPLGGLGSFFIMGDIKGGIIQLVLVSGGITLMKLNEGIATCYEDCGSVLVFSVGAIMMISGFIYGIVRPFYYDNAKNTTDKNNGFNMAILPDKQGHFKAYLFYNKAF
jgi:uncharacterized membrane protein